MVTKSICATAISALENMPLKKAYESEEKDFQDAVVEALTEAFMLAGIDDLRITASIGGNNRPRIDLFGTNVWPDVEIDTPDEKIAIELKLVRAKKTSSLPLGIKESVGQAFIYRLKYCEVIAFVVSYKTGSPNLHDYDAALIDWCLKSNIHFVFRAAEG